MLLNVLPVVGDAAGRDAGLSHQLKTDLPTQVVRDVPLLAQERHSWVREVGWEVVLAPSREQGTQQVYRSTGWATLTFLFSSTWEKSSSMSARYLS